MAVQLALLALVACDTDDGEASPMDGSAPPPLDASADARPSFEASLDGSREAAIEADAQADGGPSETPFKLSLSGSECLGDCPQYTLSLDDQGKVAFVGKLCAGRPGVFQKQVVPDDVQAVAAALADADFATLRERYVDQSDGCTTVLTDGSTQVLTLERDGVSKTVTRSSGCQGAPDTARVDALSAALIARTGAAPWLEGPFNCGYLQAIQMNFETTYLLHRGEEFVGRLALHWPAANWRFASWLLDLCDGQMGSGGTMLVEPTRRILLVNGDAPFTLPVLGEVGSIVLSKPFMGTTVTAKALTNSGEIELSIVESADCP